MPDSKRSFPTARMDDLVMTEAGNDLVIYDQRSHHLHRLNAIAASIWRHADGRHAMVDLARLVSVDRGVMVSVEEIELGLAQLAGAELLTNEPGGTVPVLRRSRRTVLRQGAVVIPAIVSISAPLAVAAHSHCPQNPSCPPTWDCCAGVCCDPRAQCVYSVNGPLCTFD